MAGRYDPEKERLKREVSIQRLAEARGIKLHRSGKELIGLCPFHDDRNPSLNIDPVANVWHCKGACGEGGALFVAKLADLGINQAETGPKPPLHCVRHRGHGEIISARRGGEKENPQKLLFAARRWPC